MKVIMTGGGTGGHIYPAIAIADKIKRRIPHSQIIFVGSKKGMENELVPNAGYELKGITVSGFSRKNIFKSFKTLNDFRIGVKESEKIIEDFKPDIVIGTGGYVCGPVVYAAKRKKIKTAIHEQNAIPGVTNKFLGKFANLIFVSFEQTSKYFNAQNAKVILSGNPLRKEFLITDCEEDRKKLGVSEKEFLVLCFGGSGGAEKINRTFTKVLGEIKIDNLKVVFVTGKKQYEEVINIINDKGIILDNNLQVFDYIENMPMYISACDLVISRAGALTVSEITACGRPSILIPSPNVTANHQYHNAKTLEEKGATIIITENDFTPENLINKINKLTSNRMHLNKMAKASRSLGITNAAETIFIEIKKLLEM